jgi:hypothetical protein
MLRRARAPARQADDDGARIKEGPLPSSPRKEWQTALQSALKHGDWSNGRTPGVTVAAIPVRIRAPQEPEQAGPRCSSTPTPDLSPGIWPPLSIDRPKHIARAVPTFQSRAHGQSRKTWIGPMNVLPFEQQVASARTRVAPFVKIS